MLNFGTMFCIIPFFSHIFALYSNGNYLSNLNQGFIHQVLIIKINQKMNTLISFMLALVMDILSTFTNVSTERITDFQEADHPKTEVIFTGKSPTVTPFKNC